MTVRMEPNPDNNNLNSAGNGIKFQLFSCLLSKICLLSMHSGVTTDTNCVAASYYEICWGNLQLLPFCVYTARATILVIEVVSVN